MKKKYFFGAIMLSVMVFLTGCSSREGPEKTTETFIRAVCAESLDEAKTMATGNVLYNLSSSEKQSVKAKAALLNKLEVKTKAVSSSWAEVLAMVKLSYPGGDTDLAWYKINLVLKDGTWMIYDMKQTEPQPEGKGGKANDEDVAAAKETYVEYLKALSNNNWRQAAAKYLAGPARKTHELSADTLGKAPVLQDIGDVTISPLWQKDEILACLLEYSVQERDVKEVVLFARLSDGQWKIAKVNAS